MLNIEKSKSVHCVETVTGQNLTGTLLLSEDEIRVNLYSYTTDCFDINSDQPIYLVAETSHVVSLYANVDLGIGCTSQRDRTTYCQGFISNVAVVGHDRWTDTDMVRTVSFSVKHSMELLRHKDKVKALGSTRYPKQEDITIFKVAASGMKLRAGYGVTYGSEFNAPKALWPIFEIEFDEPQSIHDYIKHVSNYVGFLSFCLGVKLKPDRIGINRLSHDEIMATLETTIETGTYPSNHEVQYVWPEEKIESHDLWVGGSPVRAWDEEELNALRACLVAWMDRSNAWEIPYVMMMTSFALKNVISAERIINACRWFENIPIARPQKQNALPDEDVEAIVTAATQKAEELGHAPQIRERVAGAIKWVKAESAEEQFTRLVAKIEEKFGKEILPDSVIVHLKRAIRFRGKTAHGHFNPKDDKEFFAFSKSIRAMEAFLLSPDCTGSTDLCRGDQAREI